MTYRALELLNLPQDDPAFLLDIGCGSGLSGEILDEEGYVWVGVDIAPSMLGELYVFLTPLLQYGIDSYIRGGSRTGSRRRLVLARHWAGLWLSTRKL